MPDTPKSDKNDIADNATDFEFEPLQQTQPKTVVPNFTRRIQILMVAIIIATIAYSGAWVWFGTQLVKSTEAAIVEAAITGQTVVCDQPTAKGYPFRMGLSCAKTGYADPAQNVKIEAGAFRSAAQVYQPQHIIGELDGPLNIVAKNIIPLTINWALAHASVSGAGGFPQRISLEIENLVASQTAMPSTQIATARLFAFHMRQGNNNEIDLASNLETARLKNTPAFNLSSDIALSGVTRFDAALENGKPLIEVLRGNQGVLRSVNLTFIDGGSINITGPFSLSDTGLVSGAFSVKASQATALIDKLSLVAIALGASANNLTSIKAMAIDDQFNFNITIKDDNASIGFIPLGKIPSI